MEKPLSLMSYSVITVYNNFILGYKIALEEIR